MISVMAISSASIWLFSVAAWMLAGLWEWKLPGRWQEELAAWGVRQKRFSKTLTLYWNIEDESELERRYREMRRSLPRLEAREESFLWLKIIVFFEGSLRKPAFYSRRFKDVQLAFQKDPEDGEHEKILLNN